MLHRPAVPFGSIDATSSHLESVVPASEHTNQYLWNSSLLVASVLHFLSKSLLYSYLTTSLINRQLQRHFSISLNERSVLLLYLSEDVVPFLACSNPRHNSEITLLSCFLNKSSGTRKTYSLVLGKDGIQRLCRRDLCLWVMFL